MVTTIVDTKQKTIVWELKDAACLHDILLLTSRYLQHFVRTVHAKNISDGNFIKIAPNDSDRQS
jgi:hypothetical protein